MKNKKCEISTAEEIIHCRGHENVSAGHKSTFEITKEEYLTKKGTCIVAVCADKGAADLSGDFKAVLSDSRSILKTTLKISRQEFTILSCGSSDMILDHPTDLVWRRSRFVCPRTVGIYSDSAAVSIPDNIINLLKKGKEMTVTMQASLNPEAQSPSAPPLQEFFHTLEECQCHAHKE